MADLLYPFQDNPDIDINEYGVGTITRGFGDVIVDHDPALIPNINSVADLSYAIAKKAADSESTADTDTEPGPEEGGDGDTGDDGGDTEPDDEQP